MKPAATFGALIFFAFVIFPVFAFAHQPVLERRQCAAGQSAIDCAADVTDPTFASSAVYGSLTAPKEVDVYRFTPQLSETIPVEALVPARISNADFRPFVAIFGQTIDAPTQNAQLPFQLPENWQARIIAAPEGERGIFFEPYSLERLWRGQNEQIAVQAGQTYFVAVYAPDFRTGDYSLGLGTKENFTVGSIPSVVASVVQIKLGLASGRTANWLDFLSYALLLLGIALGVGAGFCGLVSPEANVFRLSVTGGWLGLILSGVGGYFAYRVGGLSGVAVFQIFAAVILLVSLLILSFRAAKYANPRTDKRPFLWQCFAFLSWLAILCLLVWHVLVLR